MLLNEQTLSEMTGGSHSHFHGTGKEKEGSARKRGVASKTHIICFPVQRALPCGSLAALEIDFIPYRHESELLPVSEMELNSRISECGTLVRDDNLVHQ